MFSCFPHLQATGYNELGPTASDRVDRGDAPISWGVGAGNCRRLTMDDSSGAVETPNMRTDKPIVAGFTRRLRRCGCGSGLRVPICLPCAPRPSLKET
jgi:hypothetical protein